MVWKSPDRGKNCFDLDLQHGHHFYQWYNERNIVKKVWQTDRWTDGQMDGWTDRSVLRAAWPQLKKVFSMYGKYFLCAISMSPYNIPLKISYSYIERYVIYWWVKIYLFIIIFYYQILHQRFQANFSNWWRKYLSFKIALKWLLLGLSADISTLVQVMAWCNQWPLLLTWFNFNPSMDK